MKNIGNDSSVRNKEFDQIRIGDFFVADASHLRVGVDDNYTRWAHPKVR
jgi:hypothetical protein